MFLYASNIVIARKIYFKIDIIFHGSKASTGPGLLAVDASRLHSERINWV
jgi:hypothetical protein